MAHRRDSEARRKHEDFPLTNFWTRADYNRKKGQDGGVSNITKARSRTVSSGSMQDSDADSDSESADDSNDTCTMSKGVSAKIDYLEDENGTLIGKARIADVRRFARSVFTYFAEKGRAPTVWSVAAINVVLEYRAMMRELIEFQLCEDDWKADVFATYHYSDCGSTSPPIKRSKTAHVAGAANDGINAGGSCAQAGERPAGSARDKGKQHAVKVQNPLSGIFQSPLPPTTSTDPCAPGSGSESAGLAGKTVTDSADRASAAAALTTEQSADVGRTSATLYASPLDSQESGTGITSGRTLSDSPIQDLSGDSELSIATSTGTASNLGAAVARVPVSSADVVTKITAEAIGTEGRTQGRAKGSAGVKVFRPSATSMTPRNLCAIEWKKTNPSGTAKEFADHYKKLSHEDRQVFVDASHKMKRGPDTATTGPLDHGTKVTAAGATASATSLAVASGNAATVAD
ncbi:hypothetical protein B0H21DRAFT_826843 [Amylocystis lapponica]|nr:hypothetical protein B0H21DRAFT_826843 [Amylocystis lapponica]